LKTGALALTGDLFLQVDDEKTRKNRHMRDRLLLLLAAILARWRRPMAYSEALDLFYWAIRAVMASKVGTFFQRRFVSCHPGGRRGNTERVVTRWQRPVASRVAPDMLHRAI
jgi:hypothetical protein